MIYTGYELIWLFLIYSFVGWLLEVAVAAIKRHKFINRGFVNGPMCPIYGSGAVLFAIFLPGLEHDIFFLFLGGMILSTALEYLTGKVMALIFHRKWWDYSGERFHLEGYICLKTSLLWGACAVVSMLFLNPLLLQMIHFQPKFTGMLAGLAALGILFVDSVGSALAVLNLKRKMRRITEITDELRRTSRLLENALTRRIQNRMLKAFPNIEPEKLKEEQTDVFASGCSFYKLTALFFIGAFLGDIVETIFCRISMGFWMSRSSVVYGPFSIVWGLACAVLTMILYRYREKNDRYIFICGTVLGGAYEYICSVFTELVFGAVFWDYSDFAFNLGGRVNLLFCFFWGVAAVVWMKGIYPKLSAWIEKVPKRAGKIIMNGLIIFMVFNMIVSSLALMRYTQRSSGEANQTEIGAFLDKQFPDERMKQVYPKAVMKE